MYVGINSGEIRSPKEFPSKSSQSQLFCQSQLELVVASVRGMSVHGRVPVCDLNVLAGHGTHSFNVFSRNPAAHGPHSVAPSDVATEFTGHLTHGPLSGPAWPASHAQSVILSLPAGELECAGHTSQAAEPGAALYSLTAHATHGPPSGPE